MGAAESRGVEVRVIADPTVKASGDSAARLEALHVPERAYPVDDARHQIDHVKLLVADGEAVVGGMNWGRHSDRNHDYVLEIRIAADVDRVASIFDQDWNLAGGHPSPLASVVGAVSPTAPASENRAGVEVAPYHAAPWGVAEVYTLTDAEGIGGLLFAHRRGAG